MTAKAPENTAWMTTCQGTIRKFCMLLNIWSAWKSTDRDRDRYGSATKPTSETMNIFEQVPEFSDPDFIAYWTSPHNFIWIVLNNSSPVSQKIASIPQTKRVTDLIWWVFITVLITPNRRYKSHITILRSRRSWNKKKATTFTWIHSMREVWYRKQQQQQVFQQWSWIEAVG